MSEVTKQAVKNVAKTLVKTVGIVLLLLVCGMLGLGAIGWIGTTFGGEVIAWGFGILLFAPGLLHAFLSAVQRESDKITKQNSGI